jgi:hypothetical protein
LVEIDAQLRLSLHIVPHLGHGLTIVLPERYPTRSAYRLECSQLMAPHEVYARWTKRAQGVVGLEGPLMSPTWRRELTPSQISALAQMLNTALLPALPPTDKLGANGTSFTLTIQAETNSTQFTWSAELPSEWEVMGRIAELLIAIADPPFREEYDLHRRVD